MTTCYYSDEDATSTASKPISETATLAVLDPRVHTETRSTAANGAQDEDTSATELKMSQFEGLVKSLFQASALGKRHLRPWIVDDLSVGRRLTERVELILRHTVASPKPSRLDDAIDVLDDVRVDLSTFLREAQARDVLAKMDNDALYVLVRAAGRRSDDAAQFVIPWATKSGRESVREAAAEALADLNTPATIAMLRGISESDASASVREVALELLRDLDEV